MSVFKDYDLVRTSQGYSLRRKFGHHPPIHHYGSGPVKGSDPYKAKNEALKFSADLKENLVVKKEIIKKEEVIKKEEEVMEDKDEMIEWEDDKRVYHKSKSGYYIRKVGTEELYVEAADLKVPKYELTDIKIEDE